MNTLTGINTPDNSLNSESTNFFDFRLTLVAKAIREELGLIVKPEDSHIRVTILASNKLDMFYESIGDRAPNKLERELIKSKLAQIYGGLSRNNKKYDNKFWREEAKRYLQCLVTEFYSNEAYVHIRLGTFITQLLLFTERTTKRLSQELINISKQCENTLKNFITCPLPAKARARGRNGKKDYDALQAFFNHVF